MRLSEKTDKETREIEKARGRSGHLPSAFYAVTGTLPTRVKPRDYITAREVIRRLKHARATCKGMSRNEHTRLTNLLKKWEARAQGKDIRFNVMGTMPGRPTNHQARRMQSLGWVSNFTHQPKEPKIRTCHGEHCNNKFEASKSNHIWCSNECRGHHYWLLKGKQNKT